MDKINHRNSHWLAASILSVGLVLAALLFSQALLDFKRQDRYVTVKGLAEREVAANLAIWPITFSVNGDELGQLQNQLEQASLSVSAFLQGHGFAEDELTRSPPKITDFYSQTYGGQRPPQRFQALRTITVQTDNVAAVRHAQEAASDLLGAGIVLAQDYEYGSGAQFLFTGLNDIKPEMIAEATASAREAARQFANDSDSTVDGIRNANQGLFTINERDSNSPDIKIVRVVSTLQFYLTD